jgi:nicotinate phosphoribosyltransferase
MWREAGAQGGTEGGISHLYTQALLTDLYELTMAAAYFECGKAKDTAAFDLYYRHNPFKGGYAIAAGLEDAVRMIMDARFSEEDLEFLRSLKSSKGKPTFSEEFLKYLSSYKFNGDICAIPEGSVVFPNEPLLQAHGNLIECQLIETVLLCHINFQTLIATKAARIWEAANRAPVIEFGLRRSQGPDGAMSACRAAFIGGADSTSNVLGAARWNISPKGTHAHSWIQSFDSELEAFRAYARLYPDECVLLVDTYNTLKSGVPNAIRVAKELERDGHRLAGIRIDSGDLAFLSKQARRMFNEQNLTYVKIVASNDLDEYLIADILKQGGEIDIWGVGTNLATGSGEGGCALGGIYKMVEHNGRPKIKLSANPEKMTNPGRKKVIRFYNEDGLMEADALADISEGIDANGILIVDPNNPLRQKRINYKRHAELLNTIVKSGELTQEFPSLEQIRERRKEQLTQLHATYKRLFNPHEYKVGLTHKLWQQKERCRLTIDD